MLRKALLILSLALVPAVSMALETGDEAPDFTLENYDGKKISLSDYRGEYVVLEWTNPKCPFVKRHAKSSTMKALYEKYHKKDVAWLAIDTTHFLGKEDNKKFAEKYGLEYPILDDSSGTVGKLYEAKTTPHMFIINPEGKIVYQGAIDDDPFAEKDKRLNYVSAALESLLSGKSPEAQLTKSYGCSVKYAS